MGPLITEILAQQSVLTARARRSIEGVNEASFLVGRVICRAMGRRHQPPNSGEISIAMRRDLDALIEKALAAQH